MHDESDYRALLVRYMAYVISIEGWDFLESMSHDITLSKGEMAQLEILSLEATDLLEKS